MASDRKVFVQLPANFYELSEEEQLAWSRQAAEEFKNDLDPDKTADDGDGDDN